MKTVDSSVLVAGFAAWHERHEQARRALVGAQPVGQALVEAYSVLTRLPPPHRASPDIAAAFLSEVSTTPPLVLPARAWNQLSARLASVGLAGGATYDALIAATAQQFEAELLSLDVRAVATYRALGTHYRLLQ